MNERTPRDGAPTDVIVDTDMATDCDDAGALAVVHALERRGEARLRGTVTNNRGDHSVGAVAAINAYYGRFDVPLGAYQGDDVGTRAAVFFRALARDTATYGHTVTTRDEASSAIDVYRSVLAEVPSSELVIVSIGHLNNLYGLLASPADEHSSLTGRELVEQNVSELVVMGGEYPSGREHNFSARGSAPFTRAVVDRWPTPILFSGYELGETVATGSGLRRLPEHHPVRRAYADHPSNPLVEGRPSWDQTAVLAAIRAPNRYWTLSSPGRVVIELDGRNSWTTASDSTHLYLRERADPVPSEIARVVEDLMTDRPDRTP